VTAAAISDCGLYRYHLRRECQPAMATTVDREMAFVMLNPSTADATQDDPTVRRCRAFSEREGCSAFEIVNLYAYRTPSPRDLFDAAGAGIDPCGPKNDVYLHDTIRHFGPWPHLLVVAWGVHARPRDIARFCQLVEIERQHTPVSIWCLGRTKAGQPRHPLMLRADSMLEPWEPQS
jgi:hypothetical protein